MRHLQNVKEIDLATPGVCSGSMWSERSEHPINFKWVAAVLPNGEVREVRYATSGERSVVRLVELLHFRPDRLFFVREVEPGAVTEWLVGFWWHEDEQQWMCCSKVVDFEYHNVGNLSHFDLFIKFGDYLENQNPNNCQTCKTTERFFDPLSEHKVSPKYLFQFLKFYLLNDKLENPVEEFLKYYRTVKEEKEDS